MEFKKDCSGDHYLWNRIPRQNLVWGLEVKFFEVKFK
jgi:hypothetical protein